MIFLVGISLLMNTFMCCAQEYFYPAFSIQNNNAQYLYFIHQISLQQLHLLQLNTETKVLTRVLASALTPAGLRPLPDGSGYSFIDQGQLYVKLFTARSPQKVPIPLSLHTIEQVEWIDPYHCYCAAKFNDQWNLYQLSRSGDLTLLAHCPDADCLYPQKIENRLYYIQRTFTKRYSIECIEYSATKSSKKSTLMTPANDHTAITFLRMITNEQGFYIAYPDTLSFDRLERSSLRFEYHQLWYDRQLQVWRHKQVLDFFIPIDLFVPDSKERLYESLMPLLPCHTDDGIYFCSSQTPADDEKNKKVHYRNLGARWYEADPLAIYYFDYKTTAITRKAHDPQQDFIAPMITPQGCFYGYSLPGSSKNKKLLPGMWHNEQGALCYWPPTITK